MGRRDVLPDDRKTREYRFDWIQLPWVDGDYDPGGAYWGGGMGDHVYWFLAEAVPEPDCRAQIFVRARSFIKAKEEVLKEFPLAEFT